MPTTDARNSALAVGYKSDRSFVIRGDRIGVFKHTMDDNLGNYILCVKFSNLFQSIQHRSHMLARLMERLLCLLEYNPAPICVVTM